MKSLLLTLVAIAGFSLAACEEKSPLEEAADKAEDVIDKAN
jgi:predicted small lipoprotein YifL